MNPEVLSWTGAVLEGALSTVEIAVLSYLIAILLGIASAIASLSKIGIFRNLSNAYTSMVRAVPELVLIIILYYAGSQLLTMAMRWYFGESSSAIEFNGFVTAVGVLALVQGAYMSEVFRGAIQAIPSNLLETADAFGITRPIRFFRITIPCMMPNVIPGISNLWLMLLKDTALISIVGYQELFFTIQQAAASTQMYFTFYLLAGAIYLLISLVSVALFSRLETYVRRGEPAR